jgi:glycosyltransferase involved in cell wall biosynthesis
MRIAVDALTLLGQAGGRSYLYFLLKHLSEAHSGHRFRLIFRQRFPGAAARVFDGQPGFERQVLPIPNRILEGLWTWRSVKVPFTEALFGSPDLFFAACYFTPVFGKCRLVSVVYDLTTLVIPEYAALREEFSVRMANTLKRSSRIMAISEYVKGDLCRLGGADPEKIDVIPLGVDTERFNAQSGREDVSGVRARLNLTGPYILYVGNLSPHKNLARLIRAFARLKREHSLPHKLVLCGKTRWGAGLKELSAELGAGESVVFPGFVPDQDLPFLYGGAEIFAYPSLYEGFGLPPVEAMASGVPVLASNSSSLPEVCGNAAVLVDPLSDAEIYNGLEKLTLSSALRTKLSAEGLKRAALFTWNRTAELTLKAFESALA